MPGEVKSMNVGSNGNPSRVVRNGEGRRFDVLGAHLVWKARGEDTNGTFTVAEQTLMPGEGIPRHRHPYPELFFILSGTVEFTLYGDDAEDVYTVNQGDAIFVAAGTYHSSVNTSGDKATLLDIASHIHQQFFDAVDEESASWSALEAQEVMERVGAIARQHTMEFYQP
jgi:quercetin dioxygenase-like cupin family protein